MLSFRLLVADPARRELQVEARYPCALWQAGQIPELFLPVWTPGSYLVREYARHLGKVVQVLADGSSCVCPKTSKNRFALQLEPNASSVCVRYSVYAHDLTVRTCHLDETHAFWCHAAVLLWPTGAEQAPAHIAVELPKHWKHACALPFSPNEAHPLAWHADHLAHAVDAPFLAGELLELTFDACGVTHRVALDGLRGITPPDTLLADLTAIVQTEAELFGGKLPYQHYLFQCLFTDDGHGGLEHSESTTLLCARTALRDKKGYREFLALAAHELFHAWNIKRMRPKEFWAYDYHNENYTRLLWLIEGWTAYFDDWLVLRAGLCTRKEYLAAFDDNLDRMYSGPGRFAQSLEASSFDAWIRLYRPDANTRNSSQNYYGNGAVAALCLDLHLRSAGSSLAIAIRELYATTFLANRGYERADVEAVLRQLAGEPAVTCLRALVDGPLDPDLAAVLAPFALELHCEGKDAPYLGLRFEAVTTVVASVERDTPAYLAGLAPGDEILALDQLRTTSDSWRKVLGAKATVGQPLTLLFARRGAILSTTVTPNAARGTPQLRELANAPPDAIARRDAWLGNH